jgi:hypothetical protein
MMRVNKPLADEREILRPLWKMHILHHAGKEAIQGHWMLEELREHGYQMMALAIGVGLAAGLL